MTMMEETPGATWTVTQAGSISTELGNYSLLFGGEVKWHSDDWVASDDRVRGGKSQSYLTPLSPPTSALFHGHLDTSTLGGAGFASQRTASDDRVWDLSSYSGILLSLTDWDEKTYAFILKDEIPARYMDEQLGREREESSLSWECEFRVPENLQEQAEGRSGGQGSQWTVLMLFDDFKPTYRGREFKDAKPLDVSGIRRMSLMMRSFFGSQEGDFSLTLGSIKAVKVPEAAKVDAFAGGKSAVTVMSSDSDSDDESSLTTKTKERDALKSEQSSWFKWIIGKCW